MSESKSSWAQTLTLVTTMLVAFWMLHSDIVRLDDKLEDQAKATNELRAVSELRAKLDSAHQSENASILLKIERNVETFFIHIYIPPTDFFHDRAAGFRQKHVGQ